MAYRRGTGLWPLSILLICLVGPSISGPVTTLMGIRNQPKIISHSPITSGSPILYKKGLRLECHASSIVTVNWRWLRNGIDMRADYGYVRSKSVDNTNRADQMSVIELAPTDDLESSYTCVAVTRFGNDSYSFTVQNPAIREEEMVRIRLEERNRFVDTFRALLQEQMQPDGNNIDDKARIKLAADLLEKWAADIVPAGGNLDEVRRPSSRDASILKSFIPKNNLE